MNKAVIIILGKPGSGKGTQAKLLAEKLGFFHFMTSKEGKEYARVHNDAESRKQIEMSNKGFPWDSDWTLRVLKGKTQEIFDEVRGIVYDGAIRTLLEAKEFPSFLIGLFGKEEIKILNLEISDEEVMNRLEKRLICSVNPTHVFIESEKLNPGTPCPEKDGVLEERTDDSRKKIETRLEEYHQQTEPGVRFLINNHNALVVNGEQSIEDIHKDILKVL